LTAARFFPLIRSLSTLAIPPHPLQHGFFLLFAPFHLSPFHHIRCSTVFSSYSLPFNSRHSTTSAAARFSPLICSLSPLAIPPHSLQHGFFLLFAPFHLSPFHHIRCSTVFSSYLLPFTSRHSTTLAATRFFPLICSLSPLAIPPHPLQHGFFLLFSCFLPQHNHSAFRKSVFPCYSKGSGGSMELVRGYTSETLFFRLPPATKPNAMKAPRAHKKRRAP
ncbi:hypothetical protein, partial [Paenibacillus sp. MMO-177]|uniref:hypothetical protein n=1 Tax=Paenibacillus sp. MMO-177 TaxID=3081289 RepID=UPI00301738C1